MESLLSFLAVPWGIIAGMMLISLAGRWVYAIYTTVRSYRSGNPGLGTRRPFIWALPIVVLLHSGPWALATACYLAYYGLSRPHGPWLLWFFGGVAISPLFVGFAVMRASRRRKRIDDGSTNPGHAAQTPS